MKMDNTIIMDKDWVRFFLDPPQFDKSTKFENIKEEEEAIKFLIYLEAVKRAYSDMSRHTLKYSYEFKSEKNKTELTNQLKEKITKKIMPEIEKIMGKKITEDYFIKWHKERCNEIINIFTRIDESGWDDKPIDPNKTYIAYKKECKYSFTYGQAQKLLNMTIKYVYLFYRYYNCEKGFFESEINSFNSNISVLHVPIDSYVINELNKISDNSRLFKNGKYNGFSWSKLKEKAYYKLQGEIATIMVKNKISPFVWELKNWPFKHYTKDDIEGIRVNSL